MTHEKSCEHLIKGEVGEQESARNGRALQIK